MLEREVDANPYYIVTPAYQSQSAGIRCLHLLCHSLNIEGQRAFLVQDPNSYSIGAQMTVAPNLYTPVLMPETVRRHRRLRRNPILVYPDIVSGNPCRGTCIVRYMLNFPGLLTGKTNYEDSDLRFGYTQVLARSVDAEDNVLFLPLIEVETFKPPASTSPRVGTCFYADKYKNIHGGVPSSITNGSLEITRGRPNSPSAEQIAEIFQRSELFYTYENTSLAIEAVLCGCPVVFVPNPYLSSVIGSTEFGCDGYAWGTDPGEVRRAKDTVSQGARAYLEMRTRFRNELASFIEKTQAHSRRCETGDPTFMPLVTRNIAVNEEDVLTYPSL